MEPNIEKIRMEAKNIPSETYHKNFHQLMCAVAHEAIVDYVGETNPSDKLGLPAYLFNKSVIMKDLLNPDMIALSDGVSEMVASKIKENAKQIRKNIQSMSYRYDLIKVENYDAPQYR
jgi:hypothetical protein